MDHFFTGFGCSYPVDECGGYEEALGRCSCESLSVVGDAVGTRHIRVDDYDNTGLYVSVTFEMEFTFVEAF